MGLFRRTLVPVLTVLVATGFLVDPAAAAEKAETPSTTTLVFTGPATFTGKVTSAKKQCKKTRAISLVDARGAIVGKATSSKSGAWKVQFNPIATGGTFTAKVAKLKVRIATGKLTCAATTSPPVTVPPDPRFVLTVAKGGEGVGAVTSIPGGISCGSDCTETYDAGAVVNLVADPAAGSSLAGWTGACTGDDAICTVTMSQARSVTAAFDVDSHQLAVDTVGTGGLIESDPVGITCPADCVHVYRHGTDVSLEATSFDGYAFTGWGGACSGTGGCSVSMTQARSVTGTFAPIGRQLTVAKTGTGTVTASTGAISCGGTCSATYDHGTSVTLFAEPGLGNAFAGWSGACSGSSALCTVSMTEARTVNATFTAVPQQLSVSKAGSGSGSVTSTPFGINCGADCSETYAQGTVVTLTAVGTGGSAFTGWSGEGCTGTGTCQVTLSQARSVTAIFTKPGLRLDVVKDGDGHGSVVSTPAGIICGNNCSEVFDPGTSVTLTPTAGDDSTFTGWSGACTGAGTCVVTIDQAMAVTASFALKSFTLTVTKNGNGSGTVVSSPSGISCGSTCASGFGAGTLVALHAQPAEGTRFIGWTGDCAGSDQCQVTMSEARAVDALFVLQQHLLDVDTAGRGLGSVTSSPSGISCPSDCSGTYAHGTSVTLTASPSNGSHFVGWSGACSNTSPGLPCFVQLAHRTSVGAVFEQNTLTVVRVGNGSGSVTGPGINCGNTCVSTYTSGQGIQLTATAAPGSAFVGWSGGNGCGSSLTCNVFMSGAQTVTARFELPKDLVVATAGPGSVQSSPPGIDCGGDCTQAYVHGTLVTLTANAEPGQAFLGWSGDCSGTGACTVSMTQARQVSAIFGEGISLQVGVDEGEGQGSVTSSPAGINCGDTCLWYFAPGDTVTLTANPGDGSFFVGWTGDCDGSQITCTISMDAAREVFATFGR